MAFCTVCGASINGAFCSQCGAPASAASAQAPGGPAGGTAPAMPPAAPRKTNPIVWVLVALGGVFVLCILGMIGVSMLVVHKAREAGISTELLRRNPAAAAARIAALANKDLEIVSQDDRAGTLTLRDRRTGKQVTMAFDQVKNGFRISADDENGKTAVMEFGGGAPKLPAWVPPYPGSQPQASITGKGTGADGSGQGGNYTFTTSDDPSRVMSFYQDKLKELHMDVKLSAVGDAGGTLIATEDPERRMLTVVVGRSSGETTVNVTYGEKQ